MAKHFFNRLLWRISKHFALLAFVTLTTMHQVVTWRCISSITALDDAKASDWIVVLGASVYRDGRPSDMLRERLETAAAAYHQGLAPKILASGDRHQGYDEVSVMRRELAAMGVPPAAIIEDGEGFRTRTTAQRAAQVFDVERAIFVTNPFHLPRTLFLAASEGIDCQGIPADGGVTYSWSTWAKNYGRETLARILACCEVTISG